MPREGLCHRCGKPVEPINQVIVHGKVFGTLCAKEIRHLIKLRSSYPDLVYLCSDNFCLDCNRTFNCPLKSSIENDVYQLDMF